MKMGFKSKINRAGKDVVEDRSSNYIKEFSNVVSLSSRTYVDMTTGEVCGSRMVINKLLKPLEWLYTELVNKQPKTGNIKHASLSMAIGAGYIKEVVRGEYQPLESSRIFKNSSNDLCYNMYNSDTLPPSSKPTAEGKVLIDMFVEYVALLVGEENTEDFINWLAWTAQNIGKKLQWTPIIYGLYVLDRNFLTNLITTHIFGKRNFKIDYSHYPLSISKRVWTDNAFMVINDVSDGGIRKKDLKDIKTLVDRPIIGVGGKCIIRDTKDCYANFLVFSEDKKAMSDEEKRSGWWAIYTPVKHRVDVCEDSKFAPLQDLAKEGSPYGKELRHFLLNRDVSSIDPTQVIKTD